jgi:hypothetical protein
VDHCSLGDLADSLKPGYLLKDRLESLWEGGAPQSVVSHVGLLDKTLINLTLMRSDATSVTLLYTKRLMQLRSVCVSALTAGTD